MPGPAMFEFDRASVLGATDVDNLVSKFMDSSIDASDSKFALGEEVVLVKLKRAEYNGCFATIDALPTPEGSGRWTVTVHPSGKQFALKEENIESIHRHFICNEKDRECSESSVETASYSERVAVFTGCEYHELQAAAAHKMAAGNWAAACVDFRNALSVAPPTHLGDANFNLALALAQSGQTRTAAPLFLASSEHHIRGSVKWAEAVASALPLYVREPSLQPRPDWMKNSAACVKVSEELTVANPKSPVAWQALGMSLTIVPMMLDFSPPDPISMARGAAAISKASSLSQPGSSQESFFRVMSQAANGLATDGSFAADSPMAQAMLRAGAGLSGRRDDPEVKEVLRRGMDQMNKENKK